MISPPSARIVYRKLEGGRIRVRHLWCLADDNVRGEVHEYDDTGKVVLSSSCSAAPLRTEQPQPEEWEAFRYLERLTGCVSPVFAPSMLRTRDMTGVATHPATGKHRVVNSCRGGHHEIIEVHSEAEWLAAMVSGCRVVMPDGRVCVALVNITRHIGPDGIERSLIMIPDDPTADLEP